jgi:hypothetical protein
MDWTMVSNAKSPAHRIQTIFYLCQFRYEFDAREAGIRLADISLNNQLCINTIAELRAELMSPSSDLPLTVGVNDADMRKYLSAMLAAYDERLGNGK